MFSKKSITKTVISIADDYILYLTLAKDPQGFFVDSFGEVALDPGVVVGGEILKADFLGQILKKIAKETKNKDIDIVLPHDYFLYEDIHLEGKGDPKKQVAEYLKENPQEKDWMHSHVAEALMYADVKENRCLFQALSKEMREAYLHVLGLSGFKVRSFGSKILSFDHLIGAERTTFMYVDDTYSRIVEFKNGMYHSDKKFQVAYSQFIKDISKILSSDPEKARHILARYGLLRSHKDQDVYKSLIRSMGPLVNFLGQKKNAQLRPRLLVVFGDFPIPGFVDICTKTFKGQVREFDVLNQSGYQFHEVLSLHRDKSYRYQSLIAQALKKWQK